MICRGDCRYRVVPLPRRVVQARTEERVVTRRLVQVLTEVVTARLEVVTPRLIRVRTELVVVRTRRVRSRFQRVRLVRLKERRAFRWMMTCVARGSSVGANRGHHPNRHKVGARRHKAQLHRHKT
jgi:hypothetical protein